MLEIRPMHDADVAFAVKLTNQESWGVTSTDLRRLMRLNPHGCFIACDGIKKLGLTTTTIYGRKLAWIGNVIVDKNHRGRNIGHALVEHAVSYLQKARIRHVALYCYRQHVRFYEDLDFTRDQPFIRMKRSPHKKKQRSIPNESMHPPPLPKIIGADRKAFGADRSRLIRTVLAERVGWILGLAQQNSTGSYLMVKDYGNWCEIGPWIQTDSARDDPNELMSRAIVKIGHVPVEASCMLSNLKAVRVFRANGFRTVKTGYRMFLREKANLSDDSAQFALGFLDKG